MMNKIEIQNWARSLVEANPDNLNDPDNYVEHIGQVYDLGERIVRNILARYPKIPIISEEVSTASGLHDIGRPFKKDQTFHELRGANYIEQEGLKRGIANSLRDVYRIAQMFRSHALAYEYWQDSECAESRKEFEPLETYLLFPRTWQEAIVSYSDLVNQNGERVKPQDRMNELFKRYGNNLRFQNNTFLRLAKTGLNRLLKLAERVEALEQGKLTEQDILRYGFL